MIPILHQHPDFVVINKPAGIHFHSQDGQPGLVVQLERQLSLKLYPVHRLDTVTSGVLVLATNPATAAALTEAFSGHRMEKRYLALSDRKPKKKQGSIKGHIVKARRGAWKLAREGEGNPAHTQFVSHGLGQGQRAYLLRPLSGKTHQIRVTLKSLGAPILGDALYGGSEAERTYLHALSLTFDLGGQEHHFYALPKQGAEFQAPALLTQLQQWQQTPPLWPK
ncbi:tRNA pseudouridine32 synthase / 23S rRNA pseudouridine746 synthase [Ferrimonas sediminum]|uniref:tRNA pseudouridine32 synthase / 23S rRNA pseudouridine746 synthase n=1 Tax=Ferrimonas sediminum TaxID=718193 RepID=A0A1G8JR98_9GAMM|nr:TIGR01621 family pseudouridine synthase [Ferrimonas sediminum]SDI33774.1 tRNA pseudouridine32 synthase / 23S rRNA pseudouridine746 synthase [Ferrimonas sediminum]